MEEDKKLRKVLINKAWRAANRKNIATRMKAYRFANREKLSEQNKAYRKTNKEKISKRMRRWRELVLESSRDKRNARNANRRAHKLQATPKWMTKADFAEIEEWYQIAKDLQWLSEEKLHVDHSIPLQGKDVCGLHIAANLQILPASENIRKGNKTA